MKELTSHEALHTIRKNERLLALYLYTPMCGTCQVAGRMIEIVENLPQPFVFAKANLNYMADFATEYAVESVPCLLLFKDGVEVERIYAFQSVPFLYEALKKVA